MAQKTCAECGKPNIFYSCNKCNKSFCWEHTASNEVFQCPRCRADFTKADLLAAGELEFKCRAIEKSRCPKCKLPVMIKKSDKNQLYFKCTKCDWNSLFTTPLIVTEKEEDLIQEGLKKTILAKKEVKYCETKLKQTKTENQYLYCNNCFVTTLEQGNIFTFDEIASMFGLSLNMCPDLLKAYRESGRIKGVIDPIKKTYISLRSDYEKHLIEKILAAPVNLDALGKEVQLEERQVRLVLLNLTKKNNIMGRFIDAHNFIADDLVFQDLAKMIKDRGSITLSEISKKYRTDENEIKRLISEILKRGLIKAFYSPDSTTIIYGEGIQTKLLETIQEKGKIYIDRTAATLGIHSNLLRTQIKQFMDNKQIDGWYTQDRGFATLDHLKSEILGILKLYEKISMKELVSRMFLPIKYVETLLQMLINEGKLAGALSDGFFNRAKLATVETTKKTLPSWILKKMEAADNLQYILIIHKLSGTCLFSYKCSALAFDPDLVSGFLQAISSFGTEVSSQEAGLEEIKYQGFVVALSEGELIRSAFICNQSPESTLRSSIKYFTIKFEDEYRQNLTNWTGDISVFKNAPHLVEEFFKVGSKVLFLIPKIPQDTTISKEKITEKLRARLKQKGRMTLDRLETELEIPAVQIRKFLVDFALEGMGRYTIDQEEFITEDKLNEEIANLILSAAEIPLELIAEKTKIAENEVADFLNNLIRQSTVRGRIENRVFHRE
jgi:E3 UFM1-protein ligase 1